MAENNEANPYWKKRFRAWWEGFDLPKPAESETGRAQARAGARLGGATAGPRVPGTSRSGKPLWSAARLDVAETMWGQGYISPGNSAFVSELVKPLGLDATMTALDLGSGLGGSTRLIAVETGAWVHGLEASPLLVQESTLRLSRIEAAKKTEIEGFDPENFTFKRKVDAIFCKEQLFGIADKTSILDGMSHCLKSRGQMVITDYLAETEDVIDTTLANWRAMDPVEPFLWTPKRTATELQRRRFDVRTLEDITDAHRVMMVAGLDKLRGQLESHSTDQTTKAAVLEELELWMHRAVAIGSGLRVYRIFAIKK